MSASNNITKVFGKAKNVVAATRSANSVAATQAANNELTTKWLNRLRATANNNESREQHSQLQSILDYFNREANGTTGMAKIDWDSYSTNIHTPQVVDKIRAKYDQFMEAEYNVDSAVGRLGARSEAMKNLDVAMHYNYSLWMTHYMMHLEQIETLHNIGDVTQLGRQEMIELHPHADAYNSQQQEIGNISPQDLIEDSIVVRLSTQFSWGSRYCPPFVHSTDSGSAVVATLAKLGK